MSKLYMEDYSLAEVASMIADSILAERMLSKEKIISKILTFSKHFAGIKSNPRSRVAKSTAHKLRAEAQANYWHEIVRRLSSDYEMLLYYRNRDRMLEKMGLNVKKTLK